MTVGTGLLGAGGINVLVAEKLHDGAVPDSELLAIAGSSPASASAADLAKRYDVVAVRPSDLAAAGCQVVVEAAGGSAVREWLPGLWGQGVATVVMSIGALIDPAVEGAYHDALARGVVIVLPSGGIAGLDGVRSLAAGGGLEKVTITTTKSPAGLQGAPYLERNKIELPTDRALNVFEGSAREAVQGFPANVNVAIALSLAGLGPDNTKVVIRSDPAAERTEHFIEVEGAAANLQVRVSSKPSPTNPRTSYLAGASAVAALGEAVRSVRFRFAHRP